MQPSTVASNGIEIAYETFGAPDARPLLLVWVWRPDVAWHPDPCAALATGTSSSSATTTAMGGFLPTSTTRRQREGSTLLALDLDHVVPPQ